MYYDIIFVGVVLLVGMTALAWDMPINDHPPPLGVADLFTFVQRFARGTDSIP